MRRWYKAAVQLYMRRHGYPYEPCEATADHPFGEGRGCRKLGFVLTSDRAHASLRSSALRTMRGRRQGHRRRSRHQHDVRLRGRGLGSRAGDRAGSMAGSVGNASTAASTLKQRSSRRAEAGPGQHAPALLWDATDSASSGVVRYPRTPCADGECGILWCMHLQDEVSAQTWRWAEQNVVELILSARLVRALTPPHFRTALYASNRTHERIDRVEASSPTVPLHASAAPKLGRSSAGVESSRSGARGRPLWDIRLEARLDPTMNALKERAEQLLASGEKRLQIDRFLLARLHKLNALMQTPFVRTLFLDGDVFVVYPTLVDRLLTSTLRLADVAMPIDPWRSESWERAPVPPLCSALLAYQATPSVRKLFLGAAVRLANGTHRALAPYGVQQGDQSMLWWEWVAARPDLRVVALPPEFFCPGAEPSTTDHTAYYHTDWRASGRNGTYRCFAVHGHHYGRWKLRALVQHFDAWREQQEQQSRAWTMHQGTNCFEGAGATDVPLRAGAIHRRSAAGATGATPGTTVGPRSVREVCMLHCQAQQECHGITVRREGADERLPPPGGGRRRKRLAQLCFLRTYVELAQCTSDSRFDTYLVRSSRLRAPASRSKE